MNRSVSGITKRNKRSIQKLKKERSGGGGHGKDNNEQETPPDGRPPRRNASQATTYGLWFIGIVTVLFLFFAFSVVFSETSVDVHPKTASISIDETYTASTASSTADVPYMVTTVTASSSQQAESTGSEYQEARSSGELTIHNEGSDSIRLVARTRFESPEGNVYRIQEPVQVPAQSGGTPGSVTVTAVAAEAGNEYNTRTKEQFSVPGLAGSGDDQEVYATLASPMTGGIAGEVPVVSSSTKQNLVNSLSSNLEARLVEKLGNELPAGVVVYDQGRFFSFNTNTDNSDSSQEAQVTVQGSLHAITFDQRALSAALMESAGVEVADDANVRVQGLEDFDFSIENIEEFSPTEDQSFTFNIAGDSVAVWQYNDRSLARDMRGLRKDSLDEVLSSYDNIEEAEVTTRPFWKRSLPTEAEDITVNTILE